MERSLLKEMTQKDLDAYLKGSQFSKMLYKTFFPLIFTTLLTWESIKGRKGAKVMADVIAYNASAPLKTRKTIRKASGDIPKIAIKRKMDEKDYNEYIRLRTQAKLNHKAILDYVYNDVDFVVEGVEARCEFMALQALSTGALTLDKSNNNGLVNETAVDFGIPKANKTCVSKLWSEKETATPIEDIRTKVKSARKNNDTISNIIMDEDTFAHLLATNEVKALFGMSKEGVKILPTLTEINTFLSGQRLPKIALIDQTLEFEDENHDPVQIKPWKPGYVTFLPRIKVGNMKHGPIAEEEVEIKQAIRSKRGQTLVTKFSTLEPFAEYTKGQANAFPVFDDPESIYILNTVSTTKFI